jgi:hypothetical protein
MEDAMMIPRKRMYVYLSLVMLCLVSLVFAADNATWISLTSQPEGTSPDVAVLESNAARTVLRFDVPGYYAERVNADGVTYQVPRIPNAGLMGEIGNPELPVITKLVAIPNTGSVELNIRSEDTQQVPGAEVYPLQDLDEEYYPDRSIYINDALYQRDDAYPSSSVRVSEPMIMRDVRVVAVSWIPIRTNPSRGGVTASSSIEIELRNTSQPGINEKHSQFSRMTPSFYNIYRSNIVNFDELYDDIILEPGSILMICVDSSQVTSRLAPLIAWKKRKGYTVTLATTAQTGTSYGQIFSYIQNAYNTWDPPLEYVILVGDAESGTYDIPVYSGKYDHGYTQLDGTDIISDVSIGRLSFDNLTTLDNIVNKIVSYESNPFMGMTAWYTRAYLLAGTNMAYSPVITSRYIRDNLIDEGVSNVTIREYSSSTIPASDLNSNVNAGVAYMNYRGSWVSEMVCSHFQGQLSNGYMLPIAVCITCGTGTYNSGESVSECWLREGSQITPAGAVACIGTATLGTHTRFNNILNAGIFYGLCARDIYNYGADLVEAKIQLVNNFPFDVTDQQNFSYWNNLMGDPSLECWTGVPRTMQVTHPSQVTIGQNSIMVRVRDSYSNPIPGALVCLLKEGQTFITEYTDASGDLTLPITATTAGVLQVTVTKHNYRPYLANVNVVAGEYISPYAWTIDDDNSGSSHGNNNGIANPGETIELSIQLKNWGTTLAQNVSGTLTADDPYVTISQNVSNYGNIAASGLAWSASNYVISIAGDCPDEHQTSINIDVVATGRPTYSSMVPIVVSAANLEFDHRVLSNVGVNGVFDPGEEGNITITLNNIGGYTATNVTGTMFSSHPLAEVTDSVGTFGTIGSSGSGSNADPFSVFMHNLIFPGQPVTLTVLLHGDGGFADTVTFQEIVGTPDANDPTGPDTYGYWAFENVDADYLKHPAYMWVEIDPAYGGSGTLIPLSDYSEDQDDSEVITLPFLFRYYGLSFSMVTVCSNGWVAMGSQPDIVNGRNWHIPGAHGPSGMVAPFWDDLVLGAGNVYYYFDSQYHRFIVEWSQVRTRYNNYLETFEVTLYDPSYYITPTGDGEIRFQYQTVNNVTGASDDIPYATVGIESNDQSDGIEYTYWNAYPPSAAGLANGRAILFTTDVGDQGLMPDSIGPEISLMPLGNTYDPVGPYQVTATIWDISGVDHADLHYSTDGMSFTTTGMVNSSGNDWTGNIPGQPAGTTVCYYISAMDDSSNTAQTNTFSFAVWAVVYSDDFESGAPGWIHYSGGGSWLDQWHLSTEDAISPTHAWKCGDTGAGDYANFLDAYLESPEIELPEEAELHFFHRMASEVSTTYPDSAYDGGILQMSVDGGEWQQLTPQPDYDRTIRYTAGGGNPYTGPFAGGTPCWAATINWTEVTVDLSAYQGPCRFRFRFGSDQAVTAEGWYVDDFTIIGRPGAAPQAPRHVMISRQGADVSLQWDAVPGAAYYKVFFAMQPDQVSWDLLGTISAPTTTYQHQNAFNGICGFYYIVAGN